MSFMFLLWEILMCLNTLYNVCVVPWEVFSTVGDIISTVGRYLKYDAYGGYHEYHGGCSVPWAISSFVI